MPATWWFGENWPVFQVLPGYRRNQDGAPVILCEACADSRQWIISVERWLKDRHRGEIVKYGSDNVVVGKIVSNK